MMENRSVFEIDCQGVIPECGFACAKCIEEIVSTLGGMAGVSKAYIATVDKEQRLVVEHDLSEGLEELMEGLKRLPSFYKGFFVPTVIRDSEKGN